jgi:hypothetical protein
LRTLVVLILLAVVGLSAYSYWSDYAERSVRLERELLSPVRGADCTVVLRRELVGIPRTSPIPSKVDGVENSVSGRFRLMNEQWIVLDGAGDGLPQQWIPRENVLLIQVHGQ